jgi:CHASE2 domain-containing sensor protein
MDRLSALSFAEGRTPASAFRDKVVVIGVTNHPRDMHRTAFVSEERMPGG